MGPSSLEDLYTQDKTVALVQDSLFLDKSLDKKVKEDKNSKTNIYSQNPFKLLKAYPKIEKSLFRPKYDEVHFGLLNEKDYCERVDMYNLMNPQNIFENKNFFTDYNLSMIIREKIMPQLGNIQDVQLPMTLEEYKIATYPFDTKINNFYVYTDGFYRYHRIGKNYLCPTQMFNHIPGHKTIIRKDEVLKSAKRYAKLYTDKPQCFNRDMIFPRAYRLNIKSECVEFFKIINSKEYQKSLQYEPVQYLLKIGHGAHKSKGVAVLDEDRMKWLNEGYKRGYKCGEIDYSVIAQKYITNPLLLDMNNKFDFRLYVFVASTNPLIVYYHDGYMRVSINSFEKNSTDRATHLTNTYLAEKKFTEAREENKTINGMNAEELKEYHLWDYADLKDYLLETKKIEDTNWLDNYLRPTIKKSLVHVLRATSHSFWKQSNVHELYGMDFMLDENLNLWFIECNSSPLLTGVKPELIERMLLDMFEIQYAYYHSRMKRVLDVIRRMQENYDEDNLKKWKKEYKEAVKNRIEPEYQLSEGNTWSRFIDHNLLPSSDAYFGHLDEECLHPKIEEI